MRSYYSIGSSPVTRALRTHSFISTIFSTFCYIIKYIINVCCSVISLFLFSRLSSYLCNNLMFVLLGFRYIRADAFGLSYVAIVNSRRLWSRIQDYRSEFMFSLFSSYNRDCSPLILLQAVFALCGTRQVWKGRHCWIQ